VLLVSDEANLHLCRAARTVGATGFVSKGHLLEQLSHRRTAALEQMDSLWMTSGSHGPECMSKPRVVGSPSSRLGRSKGSIDVRLVTWLAFLLVCLLTFRGQGETTRTQTLQLREGWNAVYLEVSPLNTDPSVVLSNAPIDIAASYYAHGTKAQFMTDPEVNLMRNAGWGVWYSSKRPDAFLKSLHAIYGQQAYLIHCTSDHTWQVTGASVPTQITWEPNTFNLVGFSVQAQSAPTFAQFFAGSTAHQHNRIYRLTDGSWRRVLDPTAETMASGEAFWIYCDGPSRYQGPLRIETSQRDGLVLGEGIASLTLRNESDHPVSPTIEHVASGPHPLPLSIVIQAVGDPAEPVRTISAPLPKGHWVQPLPPIEAGGVVRVPLEVRTEEINAFVASSLLKVSTDVGTETWIPVMSIRNDKETR